jgi:hypothetical protein
MDIRASRPLGSIWRSRWGKDSLPGRRRGREAEAEVECVPVRTTDANQALRQVTSVRRGVAETTAEKRVVLGGARGRRRLRGSGGFARAKAPRLREQW